MESKFPQPDATEITRKVQTTEEKSTSDNLTEAMLPDYLKDLYGLIDYIKVLWHINTKSVIQCPNRGAH